MKDIEELENLPSRERVLRPKNSERYWGRNFPRSAFASFLQSNLGENINVVFSKFLKLEWMPSVYKNNKEFYNYVTNNTFMEDGEIKYYSYCGTVSLINALHDDFYVDPVSFKLCKTAKLKYPNYYKQREENRAKFFRIIDDNYYLMKMNGIWYSCETIDKEDSPRRLNEEGFKIGKQEKIIIGRRQLSKKSLKKNKISNGGVEGVDYESIRKCSFDFGW